MARASRLQAAKFFNHVVNDNLLMLKYDMVFRTNLPPPILLQKERLAISLCCCNDFQRQGLIITVRSQRLELVLLISVTLIVTMSHANLDYNKLIR